MCFILSYIASMGKNTKDENGYPTKIILWNIYRDVIINKGSCEICTEKVNEERQKETNKNVNDVEAVI